MELANTDFWRLCFWVWVICLTAQHFDLEIVEKPHQETQLLQSKFLSAQEKAQL